MSKIYKYEVTERPLELPVGAEILCVESQRGGLYLWALVSQTEQTQLRQFRIFATGDEFDPLGLRYIGTCHAVNGWAVYHVYEETGVV